ncbi:bifunctional metallophosphatase/5'-nucleotidase [Solicola gregarius]|uniref:5'-nucleotidase C-terminal domain-containing protein n=1 Tax=Solicola gregarius TaxID=2908642 RepID=A0AA46TF66_9ACTN|nr:5'-nucleotidase C-terminal domain-containing protein [Solicola gregarius]UYM04120.1 5'-nucleotidase C-terminal domain-containing protein [Solicola gregarius]
MDDQGTTVGRRTLLGGAAAASALTAAGFAGAPTFAAKPNRRTLTVLGTTDLHGNVYNWDYYRDAPYDDADGNDVGLAKIATLVEALRHKRGAKRTLLLDNGDTIQGTPLAYYYARIKPITDGAKHPMATAMNLMRFDASVVGNHEFNYGIPTLRAYEQQIRFPLLGANVHNWDDGRPALTPYVIRRVDLGFHRPVKIGILGLTTPGSAIWDKANVEGKLEFTGIVEQARLWVPVVRRAGADVVIVLSHSGMDLSSSYGDALPYPENTSERLAKVVPGIDMVLCGHTHVDIPERIVKNKRTDNKVLLTQPMRWGMRLAVADLEIERKGNRFEVVRRNARTLNANTVKADKRITKRLRKPHQKVIAYVNSVIGTAAEAMSAATSRYEDSAAMDFINLVQAQAVKAALAGTPDEALPVLSIAAPFNREAAIPAGDVSVRDVAGLYIFDNTLMAIKLTGAQVKDYLEKSVEYFKPVDGTGPFPPDDVTNAPTDAAPDGTPDYNYDIMGGLDAALTYDIDLGKEVGSRITGLAYDGQPLDDAGEYVIAINNYRQSGGGGFPHMADAPVVYNAQVEIRQLIIDWVTEQGEIDPASFFTTDWRLTYNGEPIQIQR